MSKRESNNKYTERGRSKTGRYSTVDDDTARAAGPAKVKKKRNTSSMLIAVFLILVIVGIGAYVFFNWDNIMNLSNDTMEQMNGTPTPRPTKMITPTPTPIPTETPIPTPSATPIDSPTPPPEIVDITISAVGDIMVNQEQLDDAYDAASNTYDFTGSFTEIAPSLQKSDLVIGSILTTFAGGEYGYSGTSLFNTPDSMLNALAGAGFDLLTTGNSHIFDYGWIGVERTNEKIKNRGMYTTGTYLNEEEYYEPLMIEVSGVKVAILSFTDETYEKEQISATKLGYGIKYIRKSRIKDNVEIAKKKGAEIIILCLHWGEEYAKVPTDDMRDIAQYALEQDVDVILGTKTHIIQQAKVLSLKADNGKAKERVVAYNLGNFISSQQAPNKDEGIILNLHFQKDNTTGKVIFKSADYIPTWVSIDDADGVMKNFRILPVGKYLYNEELLNTLPESARLRLQEVWNEITTTIGTQLIPALNE